MLLRQLKAVFFKYYKVHNDLCFVKSCFEKSFEYRMRVYLSLGIFNMLNNNSEMDKFIGSGWIVVQSHLSCVAVKKIRFLLSFK